MIPILNSSKVATEFAVRWGSGAVAKVDGVWHHVKADYPDWFTLGVAPALILALGNPEGTRGAVPKPDPGFYDISYVRTRADRIGTQLKTT